MKKPAQHKPKPLAQQFTAPAGFWVRVHPGCRRKETLPMFNGPERRA